MLVIQGGSDDLIEANVEMAENCESCGAAIEAIEGVVSAKQDEIGCYEQAVEFTVYEESGSVVVEMEYGDRGVWTAKVGQAEEDTLIPWEVSIDSVAYSVVVSIDCPIGTKVKMVKRSTS
ncbi:MAG: hypothetical protein JRG69_11360 [Deltaproteobacteria bacterium]|nr:hypothetical protein [Deltaproteobacteria bacterium]